jgi:hypothetical protein
MVKQFVYDRAPITIEYHVSPNGGYVRVTEIRYTDTWDEIPLDSLLAGKLVPFFKNRILGQAEKSKKPQ